MRKHERRTLDAIRALTGQHPPLPLRPAEATSVLDEDGQQVYLERFGVRYVGVQSNPAVISRKERRASGERRAHFGGGRMDVPR